MEKCILVIFLLVFPSIVVASDPTPLFPIFVAWPLFAISLLLFIPVYLKAKNSLFVNLVLLIIHVLVILWASDVGYMKASGGVVWLSLVVNICSIVYWLIKNTEKPNNE